MTNSIQNRIASLKQEAAQAGDDDMVEMIIRASEYAALCDSDTDEYLTPEDLGVSLTEYLEGVIESLDACEGNVRVNGRRVYAFT